MASFDSEFQGKEWAESAEYLFGVYDLFISLAQTQILHQQSIKCEIVFFPGNLIRMNAIKLCQIVSF